MIGPPLLAKKERQVQAIDQKKNSLSLMLSGSMVMKSFIFLSQKD